jgi:hypothetical protein
MELRGWCAGCKSDRDPAMSAPLPDDVALGASTTSSGFSDGLGRRVLSFDREEGTMLERLVVRPELGAFEKALRERLERIAVIEDERLVRPRSIERDGFGSLVVISEFVPGSRLSELLDASQDLALVPGVDAGLGYLLDVLPALCGLHAGARLAHGTIAPTRTVLTPAGQVVLLDAIYAEPLAALRYGRRKLWTDFDVATPPTAGIPRLDFETDISQAAMCSLTIALGRRLRNDEYPMAIPALVRDVANAARIRRNGSFAEGLLDFLHRALPLPGTRPYATADDALFDVRELANDLGVPVCRRAIAEFVEQVESPGAPRRAVRVAPPAAVEDESLDVAVALFESENVEPVVEALDGADAEINLDALVDEPLYDSGAITEIELSPEQVNLDDPMLLSWPEEPTDAATVEAPQKGSHHLDEFPTEVDQAFTARPAAADASQIFPSETSAPDIHPAVVVTVPVDGTAPAPPPSLPEPVASAEAATDAELEADADEAAGSPSVRQRRAKRHQRSARARKDKLRSAAASISDTLSSTDQATDLDDDVDEVPEPEPVPAVVSAAPKSSWLVSPERAAAFEPTVVQPPAPSLVQAPPAPPAPPAYAPPVAAFPPARPTPSAPLYPPIAMTVPAPARFEPTGRAMPVPPPPPSAAAEPQPASAWVPPTPLARANVTPNHAGVSPQLASVKLKEPEKRPRGTRAPAPEITLTLGQPTEPEAPRTFSWKLAVAAVVLLAAGIAAARTYMPSKASPPPSRTAEARPPAAPREESRAVAPLPKNSTNGRLEIETQPAGARILLDGKAAGESPLVIDDVAPGRHTITFLSSSGSVKRTVRVEAGRTAKVDVPIFSGWVGIFAPFIVQVSEDGRSIGTTEEPRLMLSPGKHVLTLTNKELEYSSVQTVDIEPGEVRAITIDPRGAVNFNASPWAEVWIDGKKIGDTPLANQQMPLGVREVLFKHPQFGERRVTVTVKGSAAAAVSVDMTRP